MRSTEKLAEFARAHLSYEVAMLVGQAEVFVEKHPLHELPSQPIHHSAVDDALLEAFLVHLRLLDEFLASRGTHPTDVRAAEWIRPEVWKPTAGWLDEAIRIRINRQVAHMSIERDPYFHWNVRDLGHACCEQLDAFVRSVEANSPEHARGLKEVGNWATRGMTSLSPAIEMQTP